MSFDLKGLIEHLPQAGRMRLVDEVCRVDEAGVETRTRFEDRGWLLDAAGVVPPHVGIELVAQSAALLLVRRSGADRPVRGVIARLKDFRASGLSIESGAGVRTVCEVAWHREAGAVSVSGSVCHDGAEWCVASLTLSLDA